MLLSLRLYFKNNWDEIFLMRIVNLPIIKGTLRKKYRELNNLFEEINGVDVWRGGIQIFSYSWKFRRYVRNAGNLRRSSRKSLCWWCEIESIRETGFVPKWIFSLRGAAAASGNCVTSAARRDGLEKWRENRARDRGDSRERYGQRFGVEGVSCELPHISRRSAISSKGEGAREKRQSKKCQAEINDRVGLNWFEKWRFWKSY